MTMLNHDPNHPCSYHHHRVMMMMTTMMMTGMMIRHHRHHHHCDVFLKFSNECENTCTYMNDEDDNYHVVDQH